MRERVIMIFPEDGQEEAAVEKVVREREGFRATIEPAEALALFDRTTTGKSVARMWTKVLVLDAKK